MPTKSKPPETKQAKAKRKRLAQLQMTGFRKRMIARIDDFLRHRVIEEDLPVDPYLTIDFAFGKWVMDSLRTDFSIIKRKPRRTPKHLHNSPAEGEGFFKSDGTPNERYK
jgi:hypothetical protein